MTDPSIYSQRTYTADMAKKKLAVSKKISKILKEGIRKDTHKPVSKSNPRRPVSQKQAVAVALSVAGKPKKAPAKKSRGRKFNAGAFERERRSYFGLNKTA